MYRKHNNITKTLKKLVSNSLEGIYWVWNIISVIGINGKLTTNIRQEN